MQRDGPGQSPSAGWESVYEAMDVDPAYDSDEADEAAIDVSDYVVEQFLKNVAPVHAPKGYNPAKDDCRFDPRYSRFRD